MSHNNKHQDYKNIGKHSSVFQAEIYALAAAAAKMKDAGFVDKKIEIFVDSQAALKAIDKYTISNKSVQICKQNLNRLANSNKVTLNWIPGHEGFMGNEVADRLAKRGADLPPEQAIEVPVPQTHIKQLIKTWAETKHQKIWETNPDCCRQTKMFLPTTKNKYGKKLKINQFRE